MAIRYHLDTSWQLMLKDLNISAQVVLRAAQMPLDLLARKSPTVDGDEYLRLWEGLAQVVGDDPTFPLTVAEHMTMEVFTPPLFACMCSADLNVAVQRLAYYKPLVGPLRLDVTEDAQRTQIAFTGLPQHVPPPPLLIIMELIFWVDIARRATREHIEPLAVHTTVDIPAIDAYTAYFGVTPRKSDFNGVVFNAVDARRPFLTANDQMWAMFEPSLNRRLKDLQEDSNFRDRVRACLMEIMASGAYTMSDVADRLAVSPRTLQRRLREEGTTFQKELDALREQLARNYLSRSNYSSGQIAFLLGYEDPNSFYRAFRSWTGQTPEYVRTQAN